MAAAAAQADPCGQVEEDRLKKPTEPQVLPGPVQAEWYIDAFGE